MSRRRRTVRWVGLVLVLGVLFWLLFRLFVHLLEFGPDLDVSQLLLPTLTLTLVVLALGLVGVLVRNLVRLIVDRKRGILGSRLRTKMVFFFLGFVLLPAIVLFAGSAQVIKQTVEAILRTPLEDLTRQSREIVDQWSDYFRAQSLRRAGAIADEIARAGLLEPGRQGEMDAALSRWTRADDRQLVLVTDGSEIIARAGGLAGTPQRALQPDMERLTLGLAQRVVATGEREAAIDYLGDGILAHAAVPVRTPGVRGGTSAIVVGIALPTRLAGNLDRIVKAEQDYRQFRVRRRELVRLYLTAIALIFLVTLFIATWIGFYLSRRLTEPIQEMAAASREISAGNLDVRVRAQVGDEMGTLIVAFNEMAGQLQENREVITRSTSDLRSSYRALEERRRYIETLLANLSTAVLSLDTAGRVTTANPAVREILGINLIAGDDAREVFNSHGLEPLVRMLEDALPSRADGVRRDLTIERDAGTLIVSVQVSPLHGGGGEELGTLVMLEDLTEFTRAQKAAAWREIARRIAHEIKNPLTPIQLAAQRLRKKFAENAADLPRVVPEATASIEREVAALKQLVDEFSRFARMPEVAPREADVGELVETVLALYKGLPSVRWEVDVDPAVGEFRLDPDQIRRVMINLIDNAVTAMGRKGTIGIRVRPAGGDGRLRIEVSDSGPGIPPEDRDKMFSPYFSTKKRGTGLGLAIVHKVVTDHFGTIRVEPNDPSGATFVIEIPA